MAHPDDDVRGYFKRVLIPEREAWVALVDHEAVGIMALDGDWVDQLYLAPGWTGQGIGAQLLGVAKEERPAGLRLWTFQSNRGAQRFYERHGFVEVRRTSGDNEEHAPDILYMWNPQ